MIFGAGFVLLGLVGLVVRLRYPGKLSELCAALVATRAGRLLAVLVWGWLGWHFLAR
jgi:flagellar motor component MotA